jgi:phage terminase large subunit-like protein
MAATFCPVFGGRWTPEPLQADGSPYPTMGYAAAAWIVAKCGLELDPWQVEILRRAWLYDPDTLDWIVEDVVIVGPEGIGKSAFFAAVGLWLLDGPCLPPAEAPRRHERPNIPIVSAALSLTEHIHRHAKHYVEREGSPLAGRITVETSRIFRTGHEAHRLAFPAGSGSLQQGGEPVPAILEEELHVLNAPGVRATGEEAVRITSSKRMKNANPKVQRFTITNPDDGNPDSLLGQRWRYASRVLDGELVDPSLLAIHYHAQLPIDLDDPADLRRGILEATPSSWVDVETIARKHEKGEQGVGWTMRFSLGLFYAGDDQVLGEGLLESRAVPLELADAPPPDVPVALAFDGARNRDSVALYGVTADGFGFVVASWERPDNAGEGWRYPRDEIADAVADAMDRAHPRALLGVDPTWFEDLVYGTATSDGWADRWPGRVVVDVQQHGAQAWAAFRQAVIDGGFTHDGDPRLIRHMRNAVELTRTVRGRKVAQLAKKRDDGAHPIDLLVTATYAYRLAMHLEEHDQDDGSVDALRAALGMKG